MLLRFVSWIAVSSEPQAERESPVEQREANREFVENLGQYYPGYQGVIVREFSLAATRSITLLSDACEMYEQYRDLVAMIQAREFDALVCRSRDRLGRRLSLVATLERLCVDHGIVVVPRNSLPPSLDAAEMRNSESAGLLSALEASMSEIEINRFRQRHQMGMIGRVKNRRIFPGKIPYGYEYRYLENGERQIVIVPEQAEVVRAIMDLYLAGMSFNAIAKHLSDQGIRSPEGCAFVYNTVQRFIDNVDRYAGWIELNKRSNPRTGVQRPYVRVRGDYEPIISEEMAQAVREERQRRRSMAPKWNKFPKMLRGVVYCEICGRRCKYTTSRSIARRGEKTYSYQYYYLTCARARQHGNTRAVRVNQDRIMEAVRQAVRYLYDVDISQVVQNPPDLEVWERRIENIQAKLADLQDARDRLVAAYIDHGVIDVDVFSEKKSQLEARESSLKQELARSERVLNELGDLESRRERALTLRDQGEKMLAVAEEDPDGFASWLRQFIRVYIGPVDDGEKWGIVRIVYV